MEMISLETSKGSCAVKIVLGKIWGIDDEKNSFLIDEQVANIFALLVLIPYRMLIKSLEEVAAGKMTIEDVAEFFGVETSALRSRLKLEETQND